MRKEGHDKIIYETFEEITIAIAENCDLHDAKLIDIAMASDRKHAEFTFILNRYLFEFVFIDLLEYSIFCDTAYELYTFEIYIKDETDGIRTCFDGIGMEFKSKKLEMSKKYIDRD